MNELLIAATTATAAAVATNEITYDSSAFY